MPRSVVAIPLTADAFAPYGDVVSAGLKQGSSANQGTAVRFDWCASLVTTRNDARPNLAVFRSVAKTLPFEVKLLERHPCNTQAFIPMITQRFLIVVAPQLSDGGPDVTRLTAFVCGPGQGINYKPNTWHHPIIALDAPAEFAMLAWEDGSAQDCEERALVEPIHITT
jgi:ureidoglycolate lyase